MIYFLSDAHLGSRVMENPEKHQACVVSLLHQMEKDADAVYLLGDMFDFWYEYIYFRHETLEEYAARTKEKGFSSFLFALRDMVRKGIEVHFFTGNHDIWTFGWLQRETGIIVHTEPFETMLYGLRVYMAHGDGLVPTSFWEQFSLSQKRRIRRFMYLRAFFHHPVPQFLFRLLPPALGDALGYEWAHRSRLRELAHPCAYKGEGNEELVLFAKEREAQRATHGQPATDLYVFGHRHIELDLQISRTSRVAVLGDFFQQWTYASLSPEGTFLLCNYQ